MTRLTPQRAADFVAACRAAGTEANEAFQRAFDLPVVMTVGEAAPLAADALPAELAGAGLLVLLLVDGAGGVLVVPEAKGLVPAWCAAPDATGQSKLATLAQELGMLLLPEDCMPDDGKAFRVANLAEAIRRGGPAEGAMQIGLTLAASGAETAASLIWPVADPAKLADPPVEQPAQQAAKQPAKQPVQQGAKQSVALKPVAVRHRRPPSMGDLPHFSRSILKVSVPVRVTLAEKRQSLQRIVELGPGTIIQFDKSCEESLDLEIGNCRIAAGEAVKVGDKFGLRITSILLPEERFQPVKHA